jgi:protocatechuate 3,4-dioxygenase beta subunit
MLKVYFGKLYSFCQSILLMLISIFAAGNSLASSAAQGVPISGQVIDLATGEKISGATVVLRPVSFSAENHQVDTAKSSSNGAFKFLSVAPGRYFISVSAETYLSDSQSRLRSIDVHDEGSIEHFTFLLNPGASISGAIFDGEGAVVRSALVEAFRIDGANGQSKLQRVARIMCDEKGQYRVDGLAPGQYKLLASIVRGKVKTREGGTPQAAQSPYVSIVPTWYPGSTAVAGAEVVDVQKIDRVTGVNITLSRESVHTLSGQVEPPFDTGLDDSVSVWISPLDANSDTSTLGHAVSVTSDGTFSFKNLVPGDYRVALKNLDAGWRVLDQAYVSLAHSDLSGVSLRFHHPHQIEGSISFESGSKLNCQNTRIGASTGDGIDITNRSDSKLVSADSNCAFRLRDLDPTIYFITVSPPSGYYVSGTMLNRLPLNSLSIDLSKVSETSSLDLTLSSGSAEIDGKIETGDSANTTAFGVAVLLAQQFDQQTPITTTISKGRFHLANIKPGTYYLLAVDQYRRALWQNPVFERAIQGEGLKIELNPNQTLDASIKLLPSERIMQASVSSGISNF